MAGGEGHGLRDGLVIAEVALAMMLVIGGGLMTRSFLTLMRVDAGFTPGNLLVVQYSQRTPPNVDFPGVYRQMLERVRAVPGVVSAGAARAAPLKGIGERWGYRTPGMELPVGEQAPSAMTINVSDAYFRTIGARIVDGREFEPTDRRGAPIVLVVNEAFAKQWFPGKRAVGERVLIGDEPVEIVGVVHDILQTGIAEPAAPAVYISNFQIPRVSIMMVVRTQGPPTALAGALRQAIWSVDPLQPITSIFTLDDAVSDALARPRLLTVLLGIFGALGLVLGALGLYGVLAYLVSQRQREIGVRLALGASPGGVLGMIVRRGLTLAMAGVVLGLVGALALGRYLALVLYGVSATDPLTLAAVATALLGVAALASLLPARRAAGVDPAVTLRAE